MANFNQVIEQYRKEGLSKRDVGARFENLIKKYLLAYQVYGNDKVDKVWLWKDWSYKSQFGNQDTGIDLVAVTTEGGYWAIQCKCQAADSWINKTDVDSFLATAGKKWIDDQQQTCSFKLCVFVATTNNWSTNAEMVFQNRTIDVFQIKLADLENAPIDWQALNDLDDDDHVFMTKYPLWDHQQAALDAVHEYFQTNDRGKLIMACGTGKTFTALRIAEHETGANGFVLFLVPSISLLRQVFIEWRDQKTIPINFVWICSDPNASRINKRFEKIAFDRSDLPWPATTDVQQIVDNVTICLSKPAMTVVFSTYQSIAVVNKLQAIITKPFDLIICDEAHRTTGVTLADQEDESYFQKVHNQDYIQGTKRLYMTATPLIYHDNLKTKLDLKNVTYISMDNEVNYGTDIYRLSFGNAVANGLLTNYKLMLLTFNEHDVDRATLKHLLTSLTLLTSKETWENKKRNSIKLLGCINALKKVIVDNDEAKADMGTDPMQFAVAFCNTIKDSEEITKLFNEIRDYNLKNHAGTYLVSAKHLDGTMSTIKRDQLLDWLKTDHDQQEARVLTNVRCLNEGIDVPALDAVLFLSARSSKIDIVQSIGRVMRKSPGKKCGYIIIPVVINNQTASDSASGDIIFTKNYPEYKIVWSVINALLAHDASFDNEISKLTYNSGKYNKDDRLVIGQVQADGIKINQVDDQGSINNYIEDFRDLIKAKTITHQQLFWLRWVNEINKVYESQKYQINITLRKDNNFYQTFNKSYQLFKTINEHLSTSAFTEMIAQHVVMQPVFKALFANDVAQDNWVNTNLNLVLKQLNTATSVKDQQKLDEFYKSIKSKTENIDTTVGKQALIIDIYDKFFKIAFPKEVAKLGIVYTPTPIVDFIVKSVADLLPIHFQNTTINDHGVYIIDPFTGTGSFIVRLLTNNLIQPEHLLHKYQHEIYANEITLLAYYVALINIINSFHDLKVPGAGGAYTNFHNIHFLDTFQATEANYHDWDHFHKTYYNNDININLKKPPITIMIGNPPYSAKQPSVNDQNQNTIYPELHKRISDTYVNLSSSRNVTQYDSYYKAFRWSTDRLHPVGGDYKFCY